MTLAEFLAIQQQLMSAFGWFLRWWLILFATGGVLATVVVSIIVATRSMLSKT
jgi:hypothetical protein